MKNKERLELAKWVIAKARSYGADDAAVNVSGSREVDVEFRDRKMDTLKESTSQSLSLSVYAKNRYSSHSTNDLRKSSLEPFIEEAVGMTKYLGEDPYRTLPDPKYYAGTQDVDLDVNDSSFGDIASEDRIRIAKEIEDAALSKSDEIISCTAGYSDGLHEFVKVHSNGFEGHKTSTSFSVGAEITVADGDKGRPEDWAYVSVLHRRDFPDFEKLGEEAVRRALAKVGQTKLESGNYDLVIENRAATRLLYPLYGAMRGRSIQQKRSFLEGKIGQKIASDKLTVIDNPLLKGGHGSRLFDSEGMAAKKRPIIDKGILKSYYIDYYYAQKLGIEPTTGSASNLIIEPGEKSLDQIIAGVKKGILITGFIGGNSNGATGDFSYGIVGQLIEDGRVVKPVNEMNLSGNLTEIWDKLVEMGNDPYPYSSWRRPSMYFRDVFLSGV